MSLVAIILFRITLLNWAFSGLSSDDGTETFLFSQARLLTSLGASSLNLLVIITLNKVTAASKDSNINAMQSNVVCLQLYEYVALWLVKFEQPRTQTDFEQSYTFKMFCFQFINFYLPLIYIAMIKVKT